MEFDFTHTVPVQSITQRGTNLTFSQANNVLTVNFPAQQNSGILDSIKITYSGNIPTTGLDSYNIQTHGSNNTPVIFTLSEPYGAKDWWPCKQDLTDKIDSIEVNLHYPATVNGENMVGVSNGLLISESTIGGVKTSMWKSNYPIAAYLVAFTITNYETFSYNAGVTQPFSITNYAYAENLTNAQSTNAGEVVSVMNFYEQKFVPYPFRNERYAQVQFGWGGGMEHQTASFINNFNRSLVAHELAHQWFGDAVTCGSWHDIWINEGFATYSEALVQEHLDGQIAFDNWKRGANNTIISQPNGAVYVTDATNIWRIFSWRLSYTKGAMVLNMLRLKMGDTDFFQGIRNYVNAKNGEYATIPDFKGFMATQSGQNLDEFFADWIYGEGYPTYEITVNETTTPNQYEITVNQTTSDVSVPFYEMPLPFTFSDGTNTFNTILNHTSSGQVFTVDVGFTPTEVYFDPHNDIVKGNTVLHTTLANNEILANRFRVYPIPATDMIFVDNHSNNSIKKISIISLNGKIINLINKHFENIDISKMAKGAYFIKIDTNNGSFVQKIIKK
jgi:aminopeptidase N